MLIEAYLEPVSQVFSHQNPTVKHRFHTIFFQKKNGGCTRCLIENYAQHNGRGTHVLEQMVLLLKQKHLRASAAVPGTLPQV